MRNGGMIGGLALVLLVASSALADGRDAGDCTTAAPESIALMKNAMKMAGALYRMSEWSRAFFAAAENADGSSSNGSQKAPKAVLAALRGKLSAVQCPGDPWVQKTTATLDDLERLVDTMVADETQCRATPSCMAPRVAVHICQALSVRRDLTAQIAHEKANPGGVVDMARLHDLGEQVQSADDDIRASRASYLSFAKKPFADSLCATKKPSP